MEVPPIFVFFPIFILTFRHFSLTPLAYRLIFVHALILILGAHYTYEQVPFGKWAAEAFELCE